MYNIPRVVVCVISAFYLLCLSCYVAAWPAICPQLFCLQPCPVDQINRYDSAGCKTCDCFDPCKVRATCESAYHNVPDIETRIFKIRKAFSIPKEFTETTHIIIIVFNTGT